MTAEFLGNSPWAIPAIVYSVGSRIAYAGGVGAALIRQDRDQYFTTRYGVEPGFRKFSRMAAFLMNNDAVAFIVLCLVTRETFEFPMVWRVVGGAVLIAAGLGIKVWAAMRIGEGAYFWRNFFVSGEPVMSGPPGPYRYLKNPMYTVGYLHCYGAALLCASTAGFAAAVFSQGAILVFNQVVEKPHWDRITSGA